MINGDQVQGEHKEPGSQFSILHDHERQLLYCCHTLPARDMAGNPHVLSAGIDLAPARATAAKGPSPRPPPRSGASPATLEGAYWKIAGFLLTLAWRSTSAR